MVRKFTKFACQGVLAVVFGAAAIPVIEAKGETMKPVEKPITGEEPLTDLSQPEQALVQFYKAFNTRNIGLIDQNFATTDEVAIDNPLGGIRRGADQPHKMYQGIFASPADLHVVFWDYTIDRVGDVFWAIGRERGTYRDGDDKREINIRTSRLFRLVDGRWRQVHHHGSVDDPKALADLQNAVRSPKPSNVSSGSSTQVR